MENIQNSNSALVIDCRDRDLRCFMASVTSVESGIVIRHALDLGRLIDVQKEEWSVGPNVILMGEYQAKYTGGFVQVCTGLPCFRPVVGGLGSPFGKGGLKVLNRPIPARILRGPVSVKRIMGFQNSNTQTLEALLDGVEILRDFHPGDVFLAEGQSDRGTAYQFSPSGGFMLEFSGEHRSEMFERRSLIERVLCAEVRRGNPGMSLETARELVRKQGAKWVIDKAAILGASWAELAEYCSKEEVTEE